MLIDAIQRNTDIFIAGNNKSERKKIGQFFTSKETALFMTRWIDKKKYNNSVKILDPGCGSLILSSAVIQYLLDKNSNIQYIELDLYENDINILNLLLQNIKEVEDYCIKKNVQVNISLYKKNYLLHNEDNWNSPKPIYDIIICNPPYKKIRKNDVESKIMEDIVYGQPNLYFLFMAMSVQILKKGGDFIFIVPRSWTSGLYFSKFRNFIFDNLRTMHIHLFESRDHVFDKENVLQETMIYHGTKENSQLLDEIQISISQKNGDFDNLLYTVIKNESCIQKFNGRYMFLPANKEQVDLLEHLNHFDNTLLELGFKIKTGPVIDFRNKDLLSRDADDFPLIWASHLKAGRVIFPNDIEEYQYVKDGKKAFLLPSKNYLVLRRFTSKEEKRRLQPAFLLKKDFGNTTQISFENHINYLIKMDGEISIDELKGFYVIFNSTYWDKYYRILNGSTQVNASEINNMPVPEIHKVIELGKRLKLHNISTKICDKLIKEILFL